MGGLSAGGTRRLDASEPRDRVVAHRGREDVTGAGGGSESDRGPAAPSARRRSEAPDRAGSDRLRRPRRGPHRRDRCRARRRRRGRGHARAPTRRTRDRDPTPRSCRSRADTLRRSSASCRCRPRTSRARSRARDDGGQSQGLADRSCVRASRFTRSILDSSRVVARSCQSGSSIGARANAPMTAMVIAAAAGAFVPEGGISGSVLE